MGVALDAWINEEHLTEEAMRRYRDEFLKHPARVLVIPDFLHTDKASQLASYLAEDLEYERKYGLYSVQDPVTEEQWATAASGDRSFRFRQPSGVRPEAYLSPNTLMYMQFKKAFADPNFSRFFEKVTGLHLAHASDDIGAHAMERGDFMGSHDDDNRGRRLAIIIYLSPGWADEFGGALRITDRGGGVVEVPPLFNSLAMFDVRAGTTHEVTPVTDAAGDRIRRTIGGWYHQPPE
jgi:hypothetical protein